ncbi:MlaD family protein [Saccharopolyspora cebuensis]|uniref:MlaD family protein n=1 Tax=Saccharopolyspora cebuensis TaxID=418759 RepID=A0ABV4CLP4_9PSEU
MRNPLALLQVLLFAAVSLGCVHYVATTVLGPHDARDPLRVQVRMPDSAGLAVTSQVTYRGVQVGEVADVRLDGEEVVLDLVLDPRQRIPADARAVVSADTPMAVRHLDLQPADADPPFLRDGGVLQRTAVPPPLHEVLAAAAELGAGLDEQDLDVVATALATGFADAGPELARVLDNTSALVAELQRRRPQLERLADGTRTLAGPDGAGGDRLRGLAADLRAVTGSLREHEPALRHLAQAAPGTARRITGLLAENEPALTTLLGNLVTTGQIVSMRTPALEHAITVFPETLGALGGIVHGGTADFYLVGAQGPVCYSGTERRSPTETGPREPRLDWHCPGDRPGVGQRGAANAPRPATTTYDPVTGETAAGFRLAGGSPLLGPNPWYAIPLHGTQ